MDQGACSESAVLLGTLGARNDVSPIQISPAATSPLLTDTVKYRNTFLMLSTAHSELMALNSWENVAVLYDHSRLYFRVTAENFVGEYSSLIGFYSEIDGTNYPLDDIEAQFKVIVVYTFLESVYQRDDLLSLSSQTTADISRLSLSITQKLSF